MSNENFDNIAINFPYNSRVELNYEDAIRLVSALLRGVGEDLKLLDTDTFSQHCANIIQYLNTDYGVAIAEKFYNALIIIPGAKLNKYFYQDPHVNKFLDKLSLFKRSDISSHQ